MSFIGSGVFLIGFTGGAGGNFTSTFGFIGGKGFDTGATGLAATGTGLAGVFAAGFATAFAGKGLATGLAAFTGAFAGTAFFGVGLGAGFATAFLTGTVF